MFQMNKEELKEELIETETVQIAINDKLHRIQESVLLLDRKIERLKKEINK